MSVPFPDFIKIAIDELKAESLGSLVVYPDLDHAIEYCENEILAAYPEEWAHISESVTGSFTLPLLRNMEGI